MDKTRTNSLHEALPVELRRQVERDLVEQPPGRETYAKVFEHYDLAVKGIGIKSLERYGGYLRSMARNQWIRELSDCVVGKDLSDDIAGTIRARLLEALVTGETRIGDLMKASITEKTLTEAQMKGDELDRKREAMQREIARAADGSADRKLDAATVADLVDRVMRGEEVRA